MFMAIWVIKIAIKLYFLYLSLDYVIMIVRGSYKILRRFYLKY